MSPSSSGTGFIGDDETVAIVVEDQAALTSSRAKIVAAWLRVWICATSTCVSLGAALGLAGLAGDGLLGSVTVLPTRGGSGRRAIRRWRRVF